MSTENEPLYSKLEEDDEGEYLLQGGLKFTTALLWRRRFYLLLIVSMTLLVSTTSIFTAFMLRNTCSVPMDGIKQPYSPTVGHIHYVNKFLAHDPESRKFMGKPRPELDQAWHDLLEGTMIRVSEDELEIVGNVSSAAYKDGGYVAGLGISHNLHCLKRIKQYMHPDYYYSHKDQDWNELEKHAEHCLEGLRQSIICKPDLSLYTMEWTSHSRVKPTVRVPQAHACVDWPRLHEWMIDRAASWDRLEPPPAELYET